MNLLRGRSGLIQYNWSFNKNLQCLKAVVTVVGRFHFACCSNWTTVKHNTSNTSTLSARREKQTPKRRQRCVTFQRSEVRAPLFPIQPMLWVLFQKVLSLANGPWSHKHRDRVQKRRSSEGGGGESARSRQPRNRRWKRKRRGKGRARKWVMKHRHHIPPPPRQPAEVYIYGGGWGHRLAPQLHNRETRWETEQTTATLGHMCWNTQCPG